MLMVDTCFLIDYQRESKRRKPGGVAVFLKAHADERLQISPVAWGEFLAGFADEEHPFIQFGRGRLDFPPFGPTVASAYRKVFRYLKSSGQLIGGNDMWIAAHAIALDLPLVSRNGSEFNRVPGLRLLTY
ncbi:MAG: type II toxin-antitoxin system VapC family toxin [Opitutales bacterium]|nr:type II toxin-antitoxin system VapC family toxin [Opitutales bacterium]